MKHDYEKNEPAHGTQQAFSRIQRDDKMCFVIVDKSAGQVTIRISGDGVSDESAEWILREIVLLLPPTFVENEEHE